MTARFSTTTITDMSRLWAEMSDEITTAFSCISARLAASTSIRSTSTRTGTTT